MRKLVCALALTLIIGVMVGCGAARAVRIADDASDLTTAMAVSPVPAVDLCATFTPFPPSGADPTPTALPADAPTPTPTSLLRQPSTIQPCPPALETPPVSMY